MILCIVSCRIIGSWWLFCLVKDLPVIEDYLWSGVLYLSHCFFVLPLCYMWRRTEHWASVLYNLSFAAWNRKMKLDVRRMVDDADLLTQGSNLRAERTVQTQESNLRAEQTVRSGRKNSILTWRKMRSLKRCRKTTRYPPRSSSAILAPNYIYFFSGWDRGLGGMGIICIFLLFLVLHIFNLCWSDWKSAPVSLQAGKFPEPPLACGFVITLLAPSLCVLLWLVHWFLLTYQAGCGSLDLIKYWQYKQVRCHYDVTWDRL